MCVLLFSKCWQFKNLRSRTFKILGKIFQNSGICSNVFSYRILIKFVFNSINSFYFWKKNLVVVEEHTTKLLTVNENVPTSRSSPSISPSNNCNRHQRICCHFHCCSVCSFGFCLFTFDFCQYPDVDLIGSENGSAKPSTVEFLSPRLLFHDKQVWRIIFFKSNYSAVSCLTLPSVMT